MPMSAAEAKPTNHPFDPPAEVLIVDNDQSHAETVAESLERVGCRCRVATSGNEGARLIEESPFDVVITDLVMNDIDGLGILARSKADQPDAEVILMTGHGTVPSAVEAMRSGAFNYLLKPLDIAQLRASVEQGRRKLAAEADQRRAETPARREVRLRGRHRRQPADARRDRAAQTHRPDQRQRADPGRDGHRQGTGRPGHPPEQPAEEQAVRGARTAPP